MIKQLRLCLALLLPLLLFSGAADAQTCTVTQTSPSFATGGSVFGRIAAQWNAYFSGKVDANNGTLCNPTFVGTVNLTFAQITAALGYVPFNPNTNFPAHTYQGNNTAAPAPPTTLTNTQVLADLAPFGADAGSGGVKGLVPAPLPGDGAANKVLSAAGGFVSLGTSSVFGRTGVITAALGDYTLQQLYNANLTPQGRLTLTTATPVLSSTVSAATTIYYTPYLGSLVPFYDGTRWTVLQCPEISNITTNSATGSAGPAAVAATSNYDLFVWNNGGTCTLTRGAAWTNNTTRSLTLTRQDGIPLNTSTITNGPAASRGTWVGTVASNAGSTIDYIFGGSASGGTAARFAVWNAYNRVLTKGVVTDNGTAYTYTSGTTRQARASAGNQVAFLLGSLEDGVDASYTARETLLAVSGSAASTSIGLDNTGAVVPRAMMSNAGATTSVAVGNTVSLSFVPALGVHTVSANETGDATDANSFDVDATNILSVALRN